MGALLALASAGCYGLADYAGGLLSRRAHYASVAFTGQAGGLAFTLAVALLLPAAAPATAATAAMADLGWGALSGVGTGIGMVFLYRGLSRGAMSVVVPVSAVGGVALPVLVNVTVLGDRPSALSWLGVALTLPALWLVGRGARIRSAQSVRRAAPLLRLVRRLRTRAKPGRGPGRSSGWGYLPRAKRCGGGGTSRAARPRGRKGRGGGGAIPGPGPRGGMSLPVPAPPRIPGDTPGPPAPGAPALRNAGARSGAGARSAAGAVRGAGGGSAARAVPGPGARSATGTVDALIAGGGIAVQYLALAQADPASGVWPVAWGRVAALLTVLPLVLTSGHGLRMPWRCAAAAAGTGAVAALALVCYLQAVQQQLAVIAVVLSSLYPAVPVLLGLTLLRERLTRRQATGLVAAGAATVLLTVG